MGPKVNFYFLVHVVDPKYIGIKACWFDLIWYIINYWNCKKIWIHFRSQSCSLTYLKIKCKLKVDVVNDKVLEIIKEENNLNMQVKKDDLEKKKWILKMKRWQM